MTGITITGTITNGDLSGHFEIVQDRALLASPFNNTGWAWRFGPENEPMVLTDVCTRANRKSVEGVDQKYWPLAMAVRAMCGALCHRHEQTARDRKRLYG